MSRGNNGKSATLWQLWVLGFALTAVAITGIAGLFWFVSSVKENEREARRERFAIDTQTFTRDSQGIDRGWLDETNRSRR